MPEGTWDSTTGRHETLDDWLDQWDHHGGWAASRADVQRLVDEIGRLRGYPRPTAAQIEMILDDHLDGDEHGQVWGTVFAAEKIAALFNAPLTSPETPVGSPQSASEPPEAPPVPETGEGHTAPAPAGQLVDLMAALEQSVINAKASRVARRAQLAADWDGLCVAEGCYFPYLTAYDDGEGPLLLCEHHGDELALGFPLKPLAREISRVCS